MINKLEKLKKQLKSLGRVAVALSGGNDSNLLMHIAVESLLGVRDSHGSNSSVVGIYARTAFNTIEETARIEQLRKHFNIEIVDVDVMRSEILSNNPNRCYNCKTVIMSAIMERASLGGYVNVIDGNNASDNAAVRVGMTAGKELGVISPYIDCGITKREIIDLCGKYGIKVEPSNSCLATRIAKGKLINQPLLDMVYIAEGKLTRLGFPYSRVRIGDSLVTVELESLDRCGKSTEQEIMRELEFLGREIRLSEIERRSLLT